MSFGCSCFLFLNNVTNTPVVLEIANIYYEENQNSVSDINPVVVLAEIWWTNAVRGHHSVFVSQNFYLFWSM